MNRFKLPLRSLLVGLWLLGLLQACGQAPTLLPLVLPRTLPEPANPRLPSLILIGDSTVRNGQDDGQGLGDDGQWGWGNPMAELIDARRVNLVNRAIGGLSSRTYRSGGHWQRTLAFIKPGDTVLMQFGHNDASPVNDTSRARGTLRGVGVERQEIDNLLTGQKETVLSYGAYLRAYVAEIRAAGATPVICSPVPLKRWDAAGKTRRAADNYAGWAQAVARAEGVAFLDLNAWIAQRYDQLGREAVMALFPRVTPDESVHTNRAGARLNAQTVVAGLQQQQVVPAAFFTQRFTLPAGTAPGDARRPTLFIVGDSTVRSAGQGGAWGWGERIAPHFDEQRIRIANHAMAGRSSRTFLGEGRWDAVATQLRPGDVVLIQFGHNDGGRIGDPASKGRASGAGGGPEVVQDLKPDGSREAVLTFGAYLARYISDTRARGAIPVILSPIPHRDRWLQGRDFEDFAAWGQQAARDGGAHFIDLTLLITEGYRALGAETVAGFFSDARTHTNERGARFNADRVVEGLRRLPGWLLDAALRDPAAQGNSHLIAQGGNSPGHDMAPETRPEVVQAAVAQIGATLAPGPFAPSWASLEANYQVPRWFVGAKFGLFLHWGLYAVPAYHNEWYQKHMYASFRQWHSDNFGPHESFGYKDFIPLFTQEKFDPEAWAELFRSSGARFVIPTAQHHDNFALWDSAVTPFNAKLMGPRRDLIGDLAQAVRKRGMKFGVSNHGIENFQFINPDAELAQRLQAQGADLFDPQWKDFYNVADRSDAACQRFLVDWYARNVELIEKYQPDMLWFDNGVDIRTLDPLKLHIAAHYYNRARQWGKEVSLSTKKAAYAPSGQNSRTIGSIIDFEKIGKRSPAGIRGGAWQVDEPIGSSWGYTHNMRVEGAASIIAKLADTVSKNGTLLLNLSPRADGSIPKAQQDTLLDVGRWLAVNGEAIYDTHHWTRFGEGDGGGGGEPGPAIRFTAKGDALYAILLGTWPRGAVVISSLAAGAAADARVTSVTLLDGGHRLEFSQDPGGLKVRLPPVAPGPYAQVLKITGPSVSPPAWNRSGNPPPQ